MERDESQNYTVLGQKYAYATVSLILGIFCFVNLAGMEKAILAVVFGWLALRVNPQPILKKHRIWAQAGVALGALLLVIVPVVIVLNLDRLRVVIEVLSKMNNGR